MGLMDKAKDVLGGHEDQTDKAIGKIGDEVDGRTDGKYADKVDSAQQKADDAI